MTFRRTRCPHCRAKLEAGHRIHAECIEPYAEAEEAKAKRTAEKQVRMQARVERATDRQKREDQKSIRTLLSEAQEPFNEFIRLRDADLPCVSCGELNPPMKPGGQWDAGHFLSRGAYPELRFVELNCHKQCKSCNAGSGKFAHKARTVSQDFEAELVSRIGAELVDWLKGPHELIKWTKDQVRAIKATYAAKARQLKKERA